MADQGVLGLGEYANQRVLIEVGDRCDDGQATNELRDQAESNEVLRQHVAEWILHIRVVSRGDICAEAQPLLTDTLLHDLLQTGKRTGDDEQDIGGVELNELLVWQLAPTLRGHGGYGSLENLQQRLLHTFTGDIASDRGVFRLTRDLVNLIDVNDAALRLLDVEISSLQQLQQDVLHILTDIAGLGQAGGVSDCERHIQLASQRLCQVGLATACRPQQENVRLL